MTWLGTPYHHHGRIKLVGVDCAQILCAVFEAVGLAPYVDLGNYAHDWHLHRAVEVYINRVAEYMTPLAEGEEPTTGDVALFKFGRTFSHGGILVSPDTILHAYIGRGVILTRWREEDPLAGREALYFTSAGFAP